MYSDSKSIDRTGPNRTDHVRKAYILQYAPDGAIVTPGDNDPFATAGKQDNEERQFRIVVDGHLVTSTENGLDRWRSIPD